VNDGSKCEVIIYEFPHRGKHTCFVPFSVISIGPIVGCGLGPLSGIVLLSSLVLKTDENCLFKIFAFVSLSESFRGISLLIHNVYF
jgi:hypothetical protein